MESIAIHQSIGFNAFFLILSTPIKKKRKQEIKTTARITASKTMVQIDPKKQGQNRVKMIKKRP